MSRVIEMASCAEVFLIPGSFGDEPQLADLRRTVCGDVLLDLVEIAGLSAANSVLADMAATGRLVVDEIVRRRPSGDLSIVGYSFGASLALEVATQLQSRGRRIAFLGILDGPFGSDPLPGTEGGDRRVKDFKSLVRTVVVEWAGAIEPARQMAVATTLEIMGERREMALRRALTTHLRNKALRRWTPKPCDAPGLHVFTGLYGSSNIRQWAGLCSNVEQFEVCAAHEDLLKGEALISVARELVTAVQRHRS